VCLKVFTARENTLIVTLQRFTSYTFFTTAQVCPSDFYGAKQAPEWLKK
jgi:hypothetical protein